jgi:hypothetical protein
VKGCRKHAACYSAHMAPTRSDCESCMGISVRSWLCKYLLLCSPKSVVILHVVKLHIEKSELLVESETLTCLNLAALEEGGVMHIDLLEPHSLLICSSTLANVT